MLVSTDSTITKYNIVVEFKKEKRFTKSDTVSSLTIADTSNVKFTTKLTNFSDKSRKDRC